MNTPLPRPSGIKEDEEFEGVRYSWPVPSVGSARYVFGTCFGLGTIGWIIPIIFEVGRFMRTPHINIVLMGLVWIVFGLWIPALFWAFVRRRPESVIMADGHLIHQQGLDIMIWLAYFVLMQKGIKPIFPGRPLSVPKDQIELEEGRIRYRFGEKRGEIGAYLSDDDRQWLYATVEKWRE